MKLVQLTIQNINSLKDTTVIHFDHPEYIDSGLFLISGPTGAGKTTIFDAVCIALFGKTPRTKPSKDQNNVLTVGESFCRAELLFETEDGKRYLAVWAQHKSENGNLQAATHEISEQTDGNRLLASGTKETVTEVKRILKLDFDQFCKTAYVVQGAFDLFLKAKDSDKMAIFTKITGQKKYGEISEKLKEKLKCLDEKSERLREQTGGITVLSDAELEDLSRRVAELEKRKDGIETQIKTIEKEQRCLDDIASLNAELSQTNRKIAEHRERLNAFAPKAERLRRAEDAQAIEGSYGNLVTKETVLRGISTSLKKIKDDIPGLEKATQEAKLNEESVMASLEEAEELKKAVAPAIAKARKMDGQLTELRVNLKKAEKDKGKKTSDRDRDKKAFDECDGQLKAKEAGLQELQIYFGDHAADAALAESRKSIEESRNALDGLKEVCDTKKERESGAREGFLEAESLLKEAEKLCERRQGVAAEAAEAVRALEDRKKAVLEGKQPEDLESEIEALRARVIAARTMDEHRKMLKDGEPCPLCGSVHHLLVEGSILKTDELEQELKTRQAKLDEVKRLNQDIRGAEREKNDAEKKLIEAQGQVKEKKAVAEARRGEYDGRKSETAEAEALLKKREAEIRETLRGLGVSEEESFNLAGLQSRLDVWNGKKNEENVLNDELNALQIRHKELEVRLENAQEALKDAQKELDRTKSALSAKEDERRECFGGEDPDREEERLDREIGVAKEKLDAAKESYRKALTALSGAEKDEKRLTADLEKAERELRDAESSFNENLAKKGFGSREEFEEVRLDEEPLKQLRGEKESLEREENLLEGERKTRQQKLDDKQAEKRTDKSAEELRAELGAKAAEKKDIEKELEEEKVAQTRDAENRIRQGDLGTELEGINKERDKWRELWNVICEPRISFFSDYAQTLTFEQVIRYANDFLKMIKPRYLLTRRLKSKKQKSDPESGEHRLLSLSVIDRFQGDVERVTENISGGERFIVSLALALGISRLAERNARIDSLFLDEGFGTLDEESLDGAIAALEMLSDSGKMIGIITHVEKLRGEDSPIQTQIRVDPVGTTGYSRLSGPGVSAVGNLPKARKSAKKK